MPYPRLEREEYIEQAYFFRVYRERLGQNMATQDILASVYEEILSTTRLPMALEFLRGEILLNGKLSAAMSKLPHYFAPFQAYVFSRAEEDKSKFDQITALHILEREADYRAHDCSPAGLFIYQFECISRNRLGYENGLSAIREDPFYDADWRNWIQTCRLQLGSIEFADLIYYTSEQFQIEQRRMLNDPEFKPRSPLLFGAKEGRIAKANRGKDPLYMFAAFQRQLGYPIVPKPQRSSRDDQLSPAALNARIVLLEKRVSLLDAELKGNLQLDEFYAKSKDGPQFKDEPLPVQLPPSQELETD
ncbi:MAG: hypothetical protein JWM11_1371 [Planctomycetaceae bacterium]|nr:hypothetical protein [Planctomycetaceae bacterium]